MADTARPRKQTAPSRDESKREYINARRRLKRAELRAAKTRTAALEATRVADATWQDLLKQLEELNRCMRTVR